MAVDGGSREDAVLTRDGVRGGAGAEGGGDAVHDVGVAGLADARDLAVLHAHVGLDDAEHRVDDGDVGDNEVEGAGLGSDLIGRAHAVTQGLAAAVDSLVAVDAKVLLDLHIELGVAEADLVARGGAEKVVILFPGNDCHFLLPPLGLG